MSVVGCACVPVSFGAYYAEEVEKLVAQVRELPGVLADIWNDLSVPVVEDIQVDVEAALSLGVLQGAGVDALVGAIEGTLAQLAPTAPPRLESALAQLRGVKSTQDALKALAAIIFILNNDSIFHLLRSLAAQIGATALEKEALLVSIQGYVGLLGTAATAWEESGATSDALRDRIFAAYGEVAWANSLVTSMRAGAALGTPQRDPAVQRAIGHLDTAIELLNPANFSPEDLAGLAAGALPGAADATVGGMASVLAIGTQIQALRSALDNLERVNSKLSRLLVQFRGAVAAYSDATFESYQATVLGEIASKLTKTMNAMRSAATVGTPYEISKGAPGWAVELTAAREMLRTLPPEVRTQQEFDAGALAAYQTAIDRLDSMSADYIEAGVDYMDTVLRTGRQAATTIEASLAEAQAYPGAVLTAWLADTSQGSPLPQLGFVSCLSSSGEQVYWRMDGVNLVSSAAFPGVRRPGRLEHSIVHARLVAEIMADFALVEPPGEALVTSLVTLLRTLQQGRAADMLDQVAIPDFMNAVPMAWTYAGAAAICIQEAMKAALDSGQDRVFEELDTLFAQLSAKATAAQRAMQRKSVFSLDSVTGRLEETMAELDQLKSKLESLVTGLEC